MLWLISVPCTPNCRLLLSNWLPQVQGRCFALSCETPLIIYYCMPSSIVKNRLLNVPRKSHRPFPAVITFTCRHASLTPTGSGRCFALSCETPLIYYSMPSSIVKNKLLNVPRKSHRPFPAVTTFTCRHASLTPTGLYWTPNMRGRVV